MKKQYPGHTVFSFHGCFQMPDFWTGKPAEALRLMADFMEKNGPVSTENVKDNIRKMILGGFDSAREAYLEQERKLVAGFAIYEEAAAEETEEKPRSISQMLSPEFLEAFKEAIRSGNVETSAPPEVTQKLLEALEEGKVKGPEAEAIALISDGSAMLCFSDLSEDLGPGFIGFSMHESNGVIGLLTDPEGWEQMKKIVDEKIAAMPKPNEGLL